MIEPIMYGGIGFLVASLLVIGFIPLVHQRAVRLTMKRLEAVTPMSMAEIQADKDQLRAEFAMSTRRLEMSVEQMKAKTTGQLADIGRKSEAIERLKTELVDKAEAAVASEARENDLTQELATTRDELAARSTTLTETGQKLAAVQAELVKTEGRLDEMSVTADSQRVELVALRAHSEVLKGQIDTYANDTRRLNDRIARDSAAAEATTQQLGEELAKSEGLSARIGELERQLVTQTTEAEILARRVDELVAKLDEQTRLLAEREYTSDQLRGQVAAVEQKEADARTAWAGINSEKGELEQQLQRSREEGAKLQREIEQMKRNAEAAWAAERTESAVMRERINDVAAEVARLASVLEGPGSPIDAILTADSRSTGKGNGFAHPAKTEGKGTLADRIRALQNRSRRVAEATNA